MYTIFKKESRQYLPFVIAMLFLGLFLQAGTYLATYFAQPNEVLYVAVAVFITAMYAGSAAAISFSGEYDDKTFFFLRRLPISVTEIMYGKSLWLLVSTLAMLLGSLLLAAVTQIILFGQVQGGTPELWAVLGTGIAEAFVWGLFWSPRCQSQLHALLATYVSASLSGYAAALCYKNSGSEMWTPYADSVPLRWGICIVVAVAAVWRMRRWFNEQESTIAVSPPKKAFSMSLFDPIRQHRVLFFAGLFIAVVLLYTERSIPYGDNFWVRLGICIVIGLTASAIWRRQLRLNKQESFAAAPSAGTAFSTLLFNTVWQNRFPLYGVLVIAVVVPFFIPNVSIYRIVQNVLLNFEATAFFLFAALLYLFCCGSIFAADQKNGLFRLLSRFGVPAGKVWASRVLPLALLMLFSYGLFAAVLIHYHHYAGIDGIERYYFYHQRTSFYGQDLPLLFAFWFIPFAVGCYISISVKNQSVSIALTAVLSVVLLSVMFFDFMFFRLNPLWTTLPFGAAFLIASRMYAADWLRERKTWKSRLMSWVPIFVTGFAVLAAVPPVRIYSVPLISLEEIESVWNETHLAEASSPEERHLMLQKVKEQRNKPLDEKYNDANVRFFDDYIGHFARHWDAYSSVNGSPANTPQQILKQLREIVKEYPSFEEHFLKVYQTSYQFTKTARIPQSQVDGISSGSNLPILALLYRYLPWEKERALRTLNVQLLENILGAYAQKTKRWELVVNLDVPAKPAEQDDALLLLLQKTSRRYDTASIIDRLPDGYRYGNGASSFLYYSSDIRLHLVKTGLYCWYLEHGKTLPPSLDVLVLDGYLEAIPADPETGNAMEYRPVLDTERLEKSLRDRRFESGSFPCVGFVRKKDGEGGYSSNVFVSFDFLPEYKRYSSTNDNP